MNSQNKFTVISTFSGCGGSSLGYQMAGGKVLLAVEMDDNAVETYRLNFPDTKIYHGDIHNLTTEKVFELTGLKEGELDILDGSPPCQGFSTAGKRDFCDPRNQLYNEYIRLLKGLKPKVFVMENVSGLVKGKMKLIFKDILTELKQSGYNVKVRLMNTMYYNVPQSRKRLIFIGVRDDLGIVPSHPKPQTKPIPVKEALEGVEGDDPGIYKSGEVVKIIKNTPQGKSGDYTYKKLFNSKKNKWFGLRRTHLNQPAPTIQYGVGSALIHPEENRPLNINELKRVSSYPDDFIFKGGFNKGVNRIGNSVPPQFMKAIAEHIYKNILS